MNGGPGFSVEVRRDGARLTVAPIGDIDLATAGELRRALRRAGEGDTLVLDLTDVTFMDSVGVGLVVEQQKRAEREGGDFRLRRGPGNIQRLFQITGLEPRLRWIE